MSPISPNSNLISSSATMMTMSSSRTGSISSSAVETPIDGQTHVALSHGHNNGMNMNSGGLDTIKEKVSTELPYRQEATKFYSPEKTSESGLVRRGSLDSGLMLKPGPVINRPEGKGEFERSKSPSAAMTLNPSALHNPFLNGTGLTFGGVGFAMKDGNPPPYRAQANGGRSNSLRAGSIAGKSDGSGTSSFGDGASHSRSDNSVPKTTTPAVALVTAFVKDGVAGVSQLPSQPQMSKAERAAEKARVKAEKAARKADEARWIAEQEKDRNRNEEELKKKRKEEKIMKRLQVAEMSVYGLGGMVRFGT
jgi:hypothetical protein